MLAPVLGLSAALDPVIFSQRIGIEPDPWQADLLRSTAPEIILNCSRQSGKSTTSATLAVHTALYQRDSLILLLSPGLRQSGELFKKCTSVYRDAGRPVVSESDTALTLTLTNGSRIVSLPGKDRTVRGFSGVRLLIIDEGAWVLDPLYYAVRPMLAVSGGRLILMSTPFGKRGFFHHEWTEGGPVWKRIQVRAEDCPRIPPEFLAEERRTLPLWVYQQEYGCQFSETVDQLFGYDLVMSAMSDDLEPWGAAELDLEDSDACGVWS